MGKKRNSKVGGKKMTQSEVYCPFCFSPCGLPREMARQRGLGHDKWFWCYKCKKEVNMIEVREKDFTLEHVLEKKRSVGNGRSSESNKIRSTEGKLSTGNRKSA